MKEAPPESGAESVKNFHLIYNRLLPSPQASRSPKVPPSWQSIGALAACVVLRIPPDQPE